ncbi:MAG: restriction endonuclease subunit S [Candidatus Thiodiazotropha sp.]
MNVKHKRVVLGDIANISSGGTPSRSNPAYWNGNIPWVKTTQIQNCIINKTDVDEWITDEGLQKTSAKMISAGTILMAMYGQGKTRGQVSILNFDASINQACAAIDLKNGICRDFVYQSLLASYTRIRNMSNTGGQENLSAGLIKEIPITLPPLPEQQAIADLLSIWDEAIEKIERLIQAKEANLKGQIQKSISQQCNSWPHIKPKKIFDTITEKNFPEEELLSVTQDRGVIPRSMLEGRVMSPGGTTASYKLIKRGDFAISLRSFQGGIEYSNYQGIISPAYTVLRPRMKLNKDFYRLFFKSYIFIEKYLNLAVIGIRDGKQISIPDFLSIKIPVPPLEEQKEIAEALLIWQQEINLLKQLADKYKTQKRGLMQKMLTGEWRIKPKIVKTYEE